MRRLSSLMSFAAICSPPLIFSTRLHPNQRDSRAEVRSSADEVARPLPRKTASIAPGLLDRKHDDRHTVFAGKRECRGIHELRLAVDRLLGRSGRSAWPSGPSSGRRCKHRRLGRLEHRVASELRRPQHRGGVGREERVAVAAGEHHDPLLLEMAQRPVGARRFRRPAAWSAPTWCAPARRALDSGLETSAFITVASMPMRRRWRDSLAGDLDAAKNIAAADHDAEARRRAAAATRSVGDPLDRRLVDTEAPRPITPHRISSRSRGDTSIGAELGHDVIF